VEPVCLDFIAKWRGDEETGRDQLDEILREVIVISDSESDDESGEEETTSAASESEIANPYGTRAALRGSGIYRKRRDRHNRTRSNKHRANEATQRTDPPGTGPRRDDVGVAEKKARSHFKRYDQQAAVLRRERWQDAIQRQHGPASGSHSVSGHPLGQDFGGSPRGVPVIRRSLREIRAPYEAVPATLSESQNIGESRSIFTERPELRHRPSASAHSPRAVGQTPLPFAHPGHARVVSGGSRAAYEVLEGRSREPTWSGPRSNTPGLQDFLLPSIEPPSPHVDRPSEVNPVRTVDALRPTRRVPEPIVVYPRSHHGTHMAIGDEYHGAGSRIVDEVVYSQAPPIQGQSASRPLIVSDSSPASLRHHPQPGPEFVHRHESVQHDRPVGVAAPASVRYHYIDSDGTILREDPRRPIDLEEWSRPSDRVHLVPRLGHDGSLADRPRENFVAQRYSDADMREGRRQHRSVTSYAPGYGEDPHDAMVIDHAPRPQPMPQQREVRIIKLSHNEARDPLSRTSETGFDRGMNTRHDAGFGQEYIRLRPQDRMTDDDIDRRIPVYDELMAPRYVDRLRQLCGGRCLADIAPS